MNPSDQVQYQAMAIRELIAGTTPDQLTNATPCAKWTTRDLLNHLVGGGMMFGAAFKGEPVDVEAAPPDLLGDDPVAAWDQAIAVFSEGVDSDDALEREIQLPFATLPGSVVMEILKFDLLVHAWDLAQATGQKFDPDSEVVEPALATAQMIISPEARDGDTFADEEVAPAGATPIERLAAFTGRAVAS